MSSGPPTTLNSPHSTPSINFPMCTCTWHCVCSLSALYATPHCSPHNSFPLAIALRHNSARTSAGNAEIACIPGACCRGRASHRLGFRGLLSFTRNTKIPGGCSSACAHSPHWRSVSVAGCCGSQGHAIWAHKGVETIHSANVAAVRMPHYTGDLSRSWLIVPLLILFLFDLGAVGFLGPDEPRYASIGREMARSHDLITPRLDGKPWFEKPPLLYWMTAAG